MRERERERGDAVWENQHWRPGHAADDNKTRSTARPLTAVFAPALDGASGGEGVARARGPTCMTGLAVTDLVRMRRVVVVVEEEEEEGEVDEPWRPPPPLEQQPGYWPAGRRG